MPKHLFPAPFIERRRALGVTTLLLVCACGDATEQASPPSIGPDTDATAPLPDGGASEASAPTPTNDAGRGPTPITADAILAKLSSCTKVSSAPYAKDSGGTANIDVCGHAGVIYVHADMDIDCDGKSSAVCNETTDPSYQNATAASDSTGQPLDAATLPFVVVPGVSSRWSYKTSGIAMGTAAVVIYNGKVEYGVVGDVGPASIIGEASYAMAQNLGIDPNPKTGGISSGVTYVFFPNTKVSKIEDHAAAVTMGEALARQLIDGN
jgi:hypothetical protein